MFIDINLNYIVCDICQLAKHNRTKYLAKAYKTYTTVLLIHYDIFGPFKDF